MCNLRPPARPQQLQSDPNRARMKSTGSAQPDGFTSDLDDLDSGSGSDSSDGKSTGGCSPRREPGEEAAAGGGSRAGAPRRRRRRRRSSGGGRGSGGDTHLPGVSKQRQAANARERTRMRVLSKSFERLKLMLPWVPADTKLSKLDTLRLVLLLLASLFALYSLCFFTCFFFSLALPLAMFLAHLLTFSLALLLALLLIHLLAFSLAL